MQQTPKQQVEELLNKGLRDQWYVVAKSSQVKLGEVFGTKVLGSNLVLWRDEAGKVRCVEDYCPHRGAPLSLGMIRDGKLACAYHGVQMDGEGVVAKVPAFRGCPLEGQKKIQAYKVEEHRDGIFVFFPIAEGSEAPPLKLPYELEDDSYSVFLTSGIWETNYRYALENIADPMHGPYLHALTFTLSEGSLEDTVKITNVEHGFNIARVQQQGENFDWAELIIENGTPHCRVNIPYPAAGGPGGLMRVVSFVTPIDEHTSRIFFWRTRKLSGLAREAWRFLFRAKFEPLHWAVLEQDRHMLAGMSNDARMRENLYQHDIGVTRLRQVLSKLARKQLGLEVTSGQVGEMDEANA